MDKNQKKKKWQTFAIQWKNTNKNVNNKNMLPKSTQKLSKEKSQCEI